MEQLHSPRDIVRAGLCIGCGSCVGQSTDPRVRMQMDDYGELKPGGPNHWFQSPTANFTRTCPFSPGAQKEDELAQDLFPAGSLVHQATGKYQSAYVGHAAEGNFRERGSSGGMVTWVAAELLKKGLVDTVAHVTASKEEETPGKFFSYSMASSVTELQAGAKSRYYPIELSAIIRTILEKPGRYAIVGIPCFIKAVQLLRREHPVLNERIRFTLGLFCGHMKSARFVESFAWQMKVPINVVSRVEFRYKDPARPANWYNAMLTLRDGKAVNRDWWNLADGDWGAGFFMNHACNFCDDVVAETADISFGDAWVEPYSSDGRGTNVVVVRSPLIEGLIHEGREDGRLQLEPVDAAFVAETQAAGLRQRREGLSYRLSWFRTGLQPEKRVKPSAAISRQRKLIYRMRYLIAIWSHRMFRLARWLKRPGIYLQWASLAAAIYHGLAYHKGKVSEMANRYKGFKTN